MYTFTPEFFDCYFKFDPNARNKIPRVGGKSIKEVFRAFKKLKKNLISQETIKMFYENPEQFFNQHNKLLQGTCLCDIAGNSIFMHYLYILYEQYKRKHNSQIPNDNDHNLNVNLSLYESKFDWFLKENMQYISMQDVAYETFLHKIVKFRDKGFFIEICQKLKNLDFLDNLSSIKDRHGKTIFNYFFEEIKNNEAKYENNKEYYNFVNEYKTYGSSEDKKFCIHFLSKLIINKSHFKEDNFNDIVNKINQFINNNKDENVFQYIFFPFSSGINCLNCLFQSISSKNNYDTLFNLVDLLSGKKDIEKKICVSELCILDHINYVLRNMYSYNRKGENEFNYGIELLTKILPKITKEKSSTKLAHILTSKKFKKGILNNIEYNTSLTFAQKVKLIGLLDDLIKRAKIHLEKETAFLYFFYFYNNEVNQSNILQLFKENIHFKELIKSNQFYIKIIKTALRAYNWAYEDKVNLDEITKLFIEFINNKGYNTFKNIYKLSEELIEKIIKILVQYVYFIINLTSDEIKAQGLDETSSFRNRNYYKEVKKDFVLSNKIVTEYKLNKYAEHQKASDYFKLLFSSKFDFTKKLEQYNEISSMIDIEFKDNYKHSFIQDNIHLLKGKPFEGDYYGFILYVSGKTDCLDILSKIRFFAMPTFNIKYYTKLIKNYNEPFDSDEFEKSIKTEILWFAKIYCKFPKMFKVIMSELAPNINLDVYMKAIDYLKISAETRNGSPEPEVLEHRINSELINNFYFLMILLFIKKRYGKEYPYLSLFIYIYLLKKDYEQMTQNFIDVFENNNELNINNILDCFIFEEFSYDTTKYKIIDLFKNKMLYQQSSDVIIEKIKTYKNTNIPLNAFVEKIRPHLKGFVYFNKGKCGELKLTDFDGSNYRRGHCQYLIFHLDMTKDKDNFNTLKQKIDKKIFDLFSVFNEAPESLNKNTFKSIISLLESLSSSSTPPKSEGGNNPYGIVYYQDREVNINTILNLHQFLLNLKEEKKTLYDIVSASEEYKKNTMDFLIDVIKYMDKLKQQNVKELKKDICKNIINEAYNYISNYNPQENKNKLIFFYKEEFDNHVKTLINNIRKLKKNDIYDAYSELKSFINECISYLNGTITDCEKKYRYRKNMEKKKMIDEDLTKIINICFQSLDVLSQYHPEKIIDICKILDNALSRAKSKRERPLTIHCLIMKANIVNYVNILNDIKCFYDEKSLNSEKRAIDRQIAKYIIKSKNCELFSHKNIENNTEIFKDIDSSMSILEYPDINKDTNKYLMNKIKNSFCNGDDNQFFIDFLKRVIMNEYIFDTILNIISKKKDSNFFEQNKKIIIKSLYRYSEKNGYYFISELLKYINKFLSLDEIKGFIYPSEENPSPNIGEFFEREFYKIEEDENNDEYRDNNEYNEEKSDYIFYNEHEEKYLFYYSLSKRRVLNYEAIATLLNYCPKEKVLIDMLPFDLYLCNTHRNAFSLFSCLNSKNKSKIKSENKYMYYFLLFLESLQKQNDSISVLTEYEKKLFFYYLLIIILQITPLQLFDQAIYDRNDSELNQRIDYLIKTKGYKNKSLIIPEMELCIIFALYEIRGTPLLPIKKYLPEFYSKIECYCKKFKSFKIEEICLKNSFDVKYYEYLLNSFKNYKNYVRDCLRSYYNIIFIIEKEYGNILELEDKSFEYYQKTIYNLIENQTRDSFINDTNKYEDFFLCLSGSDAMDHFRYECINSLQDFTRTSYIIIQKCVDNYTYEKKNDYFKEYYKYLEIISSICRDIIVSNPHISLEEMKKNKNKNNNKIKPDDIFVLKDALFQNNINNTNRLNALKNSIDINQIKFHIIEGLKKLQENCQFYEIINNWIDDYIKQTSITNIFNDLSKNSFSDYFAYLCCICQILKKWLSVIIDFIKMEDLSIQIERNSSKDIAEKKLKDSIYKYQLEYIFNVEARDSQKIIIPYDFDENKGCYVETCSGVELKFFIQTKTYNLQQFKSSEKLEYLKNLCELINNKNIKAIYKDLLYIKEKDCEVMNNYKLSINNILEENKYYICKYIKDTATDCNQPQISECIGSIKYILLNFYYNYIHPSLSINNGLERFCNNNDLFGCKLVNKNYIDFTELIKAINNTKYHKDNNLNELFKVKAINYIINGDSTVHIYIDEIYKLKSDKKFEENWERPVIKDIFTIEIKKGEKISNSVFKKIKNKLETEKNEKNDFNFIPNKKLKKIKNNNNLAQQGQRKQKKIKLKLKMDGNNTNANKSNNYSIYFSTFLNNRYKRENIPILGYSGHVPNSELYFGMTNERLKNQVFGNEFLKKERQKDNPFVLNSDEIIRKGRKVYENHDVFVNIFDLMFTVSMIKQNEIVLCQNNISSILDNYSEPETFMKFLNHPFVSQKGEDVQINWDLIDNYVKNNP